MFGRIFYVEIIEKSYPPPIATISVLPHMKSSFWCSSALVPVLSSSVLSALTQVYLAGVPILCVKIQMLLRYFWRENSNFNTCCESEQKRFSGPKIMLSPSLVIFFISGSPRSWTISTKNFLFGGFDDQNRWLVFLRSGVKSRQRNSMLIWRVN